MCELLFPVGVIVLFGLLRNLNAAETTQGAWVSCSFFITFGPFQPVLWSCLGILFAIIGLICGHM